MTLWDDTYNSSPSSALVKSLIDDSIRHLKTAIRERMEVEHNWTATDFGHHIPGGTTVMDKGDSTAMAAVSNPFDGSLFLLQDGTDLQIHYYNSNWTQVSTLDHLSLSGTSDNDHTDLLLKNSGYMYGDLNMGGYKISTTGSSSTFGDFLIYGHKALYHLAAIDNVAALKDDCIGQAELNITQSETTQVIAAGGRYHVSMSGAFFFVPQIYAKTTPTADIFIASSAGTDYGVDVVNNSASPVEVRIRLERIT